jgi:hypothetical protein
MLSISQLFRAISCHKNFVFIRSLQEQNGEKTKEMQREGMQTGTVAAGTLCLK